MILRFPLSFLFEWENFAKDLIEKNRELEKRYNYVFVLPEKDSEKEIIKNEWKITTLSELLDKLINNVDKKENNDKTSKLEELYQKKEQLENELSNFQKSLDEYSNILTEINKKEKEELLNRFDQSAKKEREIKKDINYMNEKSVSISKMYVDEIKWFKYFVDWKEVSKEEYQKKEEEIEKMLN